MFRILVKTKPFDQYYGQMITPDIPAILERQLLLQLGERLRRLRKVRKLSGAALAQLAGISRTTLNNVEAGDPGPSMGTYLRVMAVLGVGGDMALLASDTLRPVVAGAVPSRALRSRSPVQLTVSVDETRHQVQDLQSLALHEAAVRLVREQHALLEQAKATLGRWLASGDSRTSDLWREWQVILVEETWRKVLGRTRKAQQLRQASPLITVLPETIRQQVLADVRQLRLAIVLGDGTATNSSS